MLSEREILLDRLDLLVRTHYVNEPDVAGGWTPLHEAALIGNVAVVRAPINNRADLNRGNDSSHDGSLEGTLGGLQAVARWWM